MYFKDVLVVRKDGSREVVKKPAQKVDTFSELPAYKDSIGAAWEVVRTTGLIGFRKHAGMYEATDKGWVLLEKTNSGDV